MKLLVKKPVIQALAEKSGRIVGGCSKDVAPVYRNFQLELTNAPKPRLRIVSTDMDLCVLDKTEMVEVIEVGQAIIPAKKLLEIVRECPEGDIEIETTEEVATISALNSKWSLQLMKELYPPIPEPTEMTWTYVQALVLYKALSKVRVAAGKDSLRPEQTLIKVSSSGVYATDGARVHFAKEVFPVDVEIPLSAVEELLKILRSAGDTKVGVGQTEQHILFEVGHSIFMCVRVEAKFPLEHMQQTINAVIGNKQELQVSRTDLLSAIKRCRITADEETNIIMFRLGTNKLSVTTRDKQNNSASESVNVSWNCAPRELCLNWVYLQDAVGEMESPNICLMLGEDKGVRKAPIAVKEDNFIAVLNQLRLV